MCIRDRRYRKVLTGIDWTEVFDMKPLKTFFIVNRDIMLRTLCIVAVYTFFTGASARMEDPVLLAVNTLLLQLFTLFSYMNDGFAYAAEALTGRFIGARDVKALRDCLRRCIAWGTAVSVLFVGIYIVWWRDLVGLFIDDSAANAATIVEVAGRYIVWIILIPVASAMPFIMDGIMVGATQTRVMRNSMFWATAAYFGTVSYTHLDVYTRQGVTCALAEMGIIGPPMRLPLVEGSGALREKFRKLIAEYDLR